jgi:hypothetical protein
LDRFAERSLAPQAWNTAGVATYGWPADLRDEQILEKLLALNLERAAGEAKSAKLKKPKTTRAKSDDEMIQPLTHEISFRHFLSFACRVCADIMLNKAEQFFKWRRSRFFTFPLGILSAFKSV